MRQARNYDTPTAREMNPCTDVTSRSHAASKSQRVQCKVQYYNMRTYEDQHSTLVTVLVVLKLSHFARSTST